MVRVRLSSGEEAYVNQGVWTVPKNAELARVLNMPEMQPPQNGYYAPSEDARMAVHVLSVWGGTWIGTDEHATPGRLY